MSKQPHEFSTGALVFKNLKAVGYANGPWLQDPRNLKKRERMLEELQVIILFKTIVYSSCLNCRI